MQMGGTKAGTLSFKSKQLKKISLQITMLLLCPRGCHTTPTMFSPLLKAVQAGIMFISKVCSLSVKYPGTKTLDILHL